MRLPGYCERCHRVRYVRLSATGQLLLAAGGTPSGVCSDCEEREAFTLRSSDIERCPIRSLSPRHYHRDGTCRCRDEEGDR